MSSIKTTLLPALIFVALLLAPAAFAQEQQNTPQPTNAQESRQAFKSRVFDVKHRDPTGLVTVLKPLGSGLGGATMSVSEEFNTISIRDLPENLAVMEEALRRLDKPEAPRPDIEFKVYILLGSNAATPSDIPAELGDVVKQLHSTLGYKNYRLMTTAVHRTKEGREGASNKGIVEFKMTTDTAARNSPIFYNYNISSVRLEHASAASSVQIGNFTFDMKVPLVVGPSINYDNIGFRAPLSVREGEKVVVGTTSLEDKGIVVVLSARALR